MTDFRLDAGALKRAAAGADPPAEADRAQLSLVGEAITSAKNTSRNIYNGVAQIADGCGIHMNMANLAPQQEATVMTPRWWMQQGGSLAVTLPLLFLTHKAVSVVSAPLAAGAAEKAVSAEVASKAFAMAPDKLAMLRLTSTGALYEGLFKPTSDTNVPLGRLKQAGEGGLGFLAMGLAANKISGAIARGAAEAAAPESLASAAYRVLASGAGGGAAYGFVHAQSQSLLDNFRPAGVYRTIDATGKGALLGMALSPLGMLQKDTAAASAAKENMQAGEAARGGKSAMSTDVLAGLKRDTSLSLDDRSDLVEQAGAKVTAASNFALQGRHAEAVNSYSEAINSMVRADGAEHPSLAGVLSDMARSDMFLGNHARSIESLQSAIRINKTYFGENSTPVGKNYDQLSAAFQRSGNYAEAAQALDKSLEISRSTANVGKMDQPSLNAYQLGLRHAMERLATLYEKGGDAGKADQVRQAIPPLPKVEPAPHQ